MLNDKRYPPFVADTVGARIDDLRDWVRDVEVHAGPRTTAEVWKQPSASVQKKPEMAAPPKGLNAFQNHILEVVNQAHRVNGDAAVARVARRNGVPLPLVERWLDKMKRHGVEALAAETAAVQVRMPEASSADELRRLASTISQPTANELKALAYLYDGASLAMAARITRMSKDDLAELVLDFNMFGLEALGFDVEQPKSMAVGM
jgi:transposase-like protein